VPPASPPAASLTLRRPDDWHLHLRDGPALAAVVGATARVFGRAIVMPNLAPPVTTVAAALAYRDRILASVAPQARFVPLMTRYLTDNTPPSEIAAAKASGAIAAIKVYPAGATTNSDAGVTSLARAAAAIAAIEKHGLVLSLHGEVTDPSVDVFDRERVYVERTLAPLVRDFPGLRIVLEHVTTREAVDFVNAAPPRVAATITPQHLVYSRNAMLVGGVRPHLYCLPVLKRETHRVALVEAATSGSDKFFLGTDSAPHPAHLKEHATGCAGCYTAHAAMELYAEAFDNAGALDKLEGFASFHGADFYGLPRNSGTITLRRETWTPPESYPFGEAQLKPLRSGESLNWKMT
jgi:dihydroorotase